MTKNKTEDEWLEDILLTESPYINDEGFTQDILLKIEDKNKVRPIFEMFLWITAGVGGLFLLPKSIFNPSQMDFETFSQTLLEIIATNASIITISTFLIIASALIFLKREV